MTLIYIPKVVRTVEEAASLPVETQRLQDGMEGFAVGFTALIPTEADHEARR